MFTKKATAPKFIALLGEEMEPMARSRRGFLLVAAISLAISLLFPGGVAFGIQAAATPRPIPGGIQIPKGPLIHILLPGPKSVTLPFSKLQLMGEDVEPSTITNSDGFTAVAVLVGKAGDTRPDRYNLEADIRVFQGQYIGGDGALHRGTFAMIWIDLFEPRSGSQIHDFNGGITRSGLFWTVRLPDNAITISRDGRRARVRARNVPVVDSFVFLGKDQIPATVSFDITWTAVGMSHQRGAGSRVAPNDPKAFLGTFYDARAVGTFSGSEIGFNFRSLPATSDRGHAQMGRERNGSFLR